LDEEIRPVDKQSLLRELKGPKVYVNPRTGKVSCRPTADSEPVPKTTWWWGRSEREPSSPIFSVPQTRERIVSEITEMSIYFPDFDLYEEEKEGVFWLGRIEGIGEVRIVYPQTYPAQKFIVQALDLPESFNDELKQTVWSYDGITPAGAVIVLMRLFLLRKVAGSDRDAMVLDEEEKVNP
jgi:hypothetical protein